MNQFKSWICVVAALAWLVAVSGCSEGGRDKTTARKPTSKKVQVDDTTADAKPTTTAAKPATTATNPTADTRVTRPTDRREETSTLAGGPKVTAKRSTALEENLPAVMPKVALTKDHASTCVVKVGDKLPSGQLPDLQGKQHNLSELMGSRNTVVMFWTPGDISAREELSDLVSRIASTYADHGVQIVAICVGGKLDQARQDAQQVQTQFPILFDATGEFFARVATKKLPRTYLLNADGTIAWFDLEYSRTTRRELQQALKFLVPQSTASMAK